MGFAEEKAAREIVQRLPGAFRQAQRDWALFKATIQYHPVNTRKEVLDWFNEFPKLWEAFRPNWAFTESGLISPRKAQFADEVDRWVRKLESEIKNATPLSTSLGFIVTGTVAAVAGILLLASSATAIYLIIDKLGYLENQKKITKALDMVAEGKITPEEAKDLLQKEQGGGFFAGIQDTLSTVFMLGAGALAVNLFWPQLKKLTRGR